MAELFDSSLRSVNLRNDIGRFFNVKCRYTLVLMGFLGFAVVYGMRVNLSVALIAMVNSTAVHPVTNISNGGCPVPTVINGSDNTPNQNGPFNWDEKTQGFIISSFYYGYFVTQIPGGLMAEVAGGKCVFGVGVLLTAIFTLLTPWVAKINLYLLIICRVFAGLSEGVTFPAMHAMLSQWAPPLERSRMAAFTYTGAQLGTVFAEPVSGYLSDVLGWEYIFIFFGSLGILWYIFWSFLIYDSPETHPGILEEEKEYIISEIRGLEHVKLPPKTTPWRSIFTSAPFWSLLVVQVCNNWSFYTLLSETPIYLDSVLHFDIKADALLSGLPYLVNVIFAVSSSFMADRLIRYEFFTTTQTRKLFNSIAFIVPAIFLVVLGFVGCHSKLAVALIVIIIGVSGCNACGFKVNHIDIASNFAGTLMGITNSVANIPGIIVPILSGYILNDNNDPEHWRIIFLIASAFYLFGNLIFVFFGSAKEQSWNYEDFGSGSSLINNEEVVDVDSSKYESEPETLLN